MKRANIHDEGPLSDLLLRRATEGLDPADQLALRVALREANLGDDVLDFELAAAAFEEVYAAEIDLPLPDGLEQRLRSMAKDFVATPAPATDLRREIPLSPPWVAAAGWAAALIAVAALLFTNSGKPGDDSRIRTLQDRVAELEREATDLVKMKWIGQGEYSEVQGEVLFSKGRQEGYLRLKGLPRNDPNQRQYQLWIVDPSRDKHPIDGGVFDIARDGEVLIPIKAALKVEQPAVFAITVEKPGGVVVSQGPLHVVAQL